MESALETINLSNENHSFLCCVKYSIANNDKSCCVIQSLLKSISTITKKEIDVYSTCFDKPKSFLSILFKNTQLHSLPVSTTIDSLCNQPITNTNSYSLLNIDCINPLFQEYNTKQQNYTLNQLISNNPFNGILFNCPLEITSNSLLSLMERKCNFILNIDKHSLIITSTKPSGKVQRNQFVLSIKENECEFLPMQDQSTGMEKSTTEAKSYAESITILNSTENKAPELVYEEDEMDEDGDEDDDDIDDDLNLSFVYFNNHFITYLLSFYSLALEVETSINLKTIKLP